MVKYFKAFFVCFFIVAFNSVAQAQSFYRDVTVKDSLVKALYQYGQETFYRGLDPQKASFTFQRILVLDCGHQGARAFLDKIHQKYPDVSIKIQACSKAEAKAVEFKEEQKQEPAVLVGDVPAESGDQNVAKDLAVSTEKKEVPLVEKIPAASPDNSSNNDQLRQSYQKLQEELSGLENTVKEKDIVIADFQQELESGKDDEAVSYAAIAQDQKDLIRIQQSNIDFLKSELAEAKKNQAAGVVLADDEKYGAMHQEIAGSTLTVQEREIDLAVKDNETKTLRGQLEDLEEQLRLVQEIILQKNTMIQSLEKQVKAFESVEQ